MRCKRDKDEESWLHYEKALWFCDSFGLDLLSIVFSSKENDNVISLTYGNMSSEENPGTNADTTLQILFLLDRFGI